MRQIAVVTGTRAEYGLLRALLKEITRTSTLALRLMVTGAHLSPRFGSTYREIKADGFPIADRIDLELDGDSPVEIARAVARSVVGFADAFTRNRPDLLVLLGDRYEILGAAQAALLAGIPIAHIHGGELTEGAIDDAIRHCLTKMSHFHFTAAEPYRRRVIQLGEQPERVFNVGAPGNDDLLDTTLPSVEELESGLHLDLKAGYFVVTYHPVTLEQGDQATPLAQLQEALDAFAPIKVIITGVNADPGNRVLAESLATYARKHPQRVRLETSLGRRRYLAAVKHSLAVIGNSSSGVIEAPGFGVPSVNIGDRQRGRLRARSVIDCPPERDAIVAAIKQALSPQFRAGLVGMVSPYGKGGAAKEIVRILCDIPLDRALAKTFYDLAMVDAR
jgi:UDP-hydrolysing UDP-N-acetyl-D-glucosamine 2-epimerase